MMLALILGFLWGAIGLVIGYVIGAFAHRNSNGRHLREFIGLFILILVGVGAFLNYQATVATAHNAQDLEYQVACQRQFNTSYRASLQAQLDASHEENAAQKEFLASVRGGAVTPAQRNDAFNQYFAHIAAADVLRLAHPVLPDNPCGGAP